MDQLSEHVATITTESSGRIIDFNNTEDVDYCKSVEKGISVVDVFPIFLGYFPMTTSKVIIENVTFNHFDGNVVLTNNLQETVIQFYENTERSLEWAAILQRYNQEKLINSLAMKNSTSHIETNVFKDLGFITFEYSDTNFVLSGNVPSWFQDLLPHHNYSSPIFLLDEIFPFLEVFLPDAFYLFNSSSEGKLLSGLWAEYDPRNTEVILQATALKNGERNLLFIESITERFPNQQKNIQHARETILEHNQLIKTEKRLRQLLENQEQFISIFSHDIRGPLSGAYTLLEILKKDQSFMQNFNEKQADIFGVMHKGLRDLYDYAYRLHDWSKVNFGNLDLELVNVKLFQTVNNLKSLLKEDLDDKNLTLTLNIAKGLIVKVDEPFFKNAIHNLLNNAMKFSHMNGEIIISAKKEADKTLIEIKDNGLGVPERFKKSLFEYNQKHSSKGTKGEKGAGIGLTVVKRIIDLHKGEILIESEENKGTTVSINI